ncbi:heterokaryon incompatibility protein-domain-containing protein [Podospora conica]|nr:heterokaryon incompatibility protein-domain-containing protein [Schizothecium conicum]
MRLINTNSLALEEVNPRDTYRPTYAILSHTWGDQEVTFQEMQSGDPPTWKEGYRKIVGTCKLASESGIDYAWVDTCCIDKSSSAELSEAINSMFRWYEEAEICYAYLSDISSDASELEQFGNSRWFTRGWTLQELIAPRQVNFYTSDWDLIGTRDGLRDAISSRTGIAAGFLRDRFRNSWLRSLSVAQRMSWASSRETTREEDLAYCLLGIFGINMPLLYGEGRGAFMRLQEEIMRHSDDHSIFAWEDTKGLSAGTVQGPGGLLASKPEFFSESDNVVAVETGESAPFSLTNRGIQIELRVFQEVRTHYAVLHCRKGHAASLLAIPLIRYSGNVFQRKHAARSKSVMYEEWKRLPVIPIYLSTKETPLKYRIPPQSFLLKPLPKDVTWGGCTGGYNFDPSTGLLIRTDGNSKVLVITFRRPGSSPQEKVLHQEIMVLSINIDRWKPYSWEQRFWCDYTVRYEETNPSGQPTETKPAKDGAWFATIKFKTVFDQRVFVIEVHQAETTADAAYLMLLSARMRINRLVFLCITNAIDRLETTGSFLYWRPIVEFCLVRPAILLWLAFCFWPQIWAEWHMDGPDYGLLESIVPRHMLRLVNDGRLSLVWASTLAMASYAREVKIAPRNAKLTGLFFCTLLAVAIPLDDDRWLLFLGVVVSSWAFPLAERYRHYRRRRLLRIYIEDISSDSDQESAAPTPRHRPALSIPRPGTAFG